MAADTGSLDPSLLAEGRQLVEERKQISDVYLSARRERDRALCRNNLALGRWAQRCVPKRNGPGGSFDNALSKLDGYAVAVDFAPVTLRLYRDAAVGWGDVEPPDDVGWKTIMLLANRPDRLAIIDELRAKHGKVTADLVREKLGKTTEGKPPPPKSMHETAQRVIADLANPEARAELIAMKARTEAEKEAKRHAVEWERHQQRTLKEAERAQERTSTRLKKRGPHPLAFWTDMETQIDGALVLFAALFQDADYVPPNWRTPFFKKARQMQELAARVAFALQDADPDMVEGRAAPADEPTVNNRPQLLASNGDSDVADAEIIETQEP